LKFEATDYFELIDWQLCTIGSIAESPALRSWSGDNLQIFIDNSATADVSFPRFPSTHTQAVEKCIRALPEASKTVIRHEARDGVIRARDSQFCQIDNVNIYHKAQNMHAVKNISKLPSSIDSKLIFTGNSYGSFYLIFL